MLEKKLFHYYSFEPAGIRKLGIIFELLRDEKNRFGRDTLSIVDVGCGNGHLAAFMNELGNKVVGLDENESALRVAQEKYGRPGVEFKKIRLNELVGKLDVITAFEVCEHIPNLNDFLNEVKNKLDDNGLFLISVPNGWSVEEMVRHAVQHTAWGQKLKFFIRRKNILPKSNTQSAADSPHVHFNGYKKWKKIFEQNGIKIEKSFKVSFFFKQFYYLGARRFVKPESRMFIFLDKLDNHLVKFIPKCMADGWVIAMRKK